MAKPKTYSIEEAYEILTAMEQKDQVNVFKLFQQYLEDEKQKAKQSVELLGEVVKDGK